MKKLISVFLLLSVSILSSHAADTSMIVKQSAHDVNQTIDRLEKVLKDKGVKVFLRVDHAKGAKNVGNPLRPTQLLIFGSPKMGSPLMMKNQQIGIDLPLKAIAWTDKSGKTWLAYNNPSYLAKRHQISVDHPVIKKMTKVLTKFSQFAVTK